MSLQWAALASFNEMGRVKKAGFICITRVCLVPKKYYRNGQSLWIFMGKMFFEIFDA